MDIRRVGGGVWTLAWVVGGVVMDHTLPETLSRAQTLILWGVVALMAAVGLVLMVWPYRRRPGVAKDNPTTGIRLGSGSFTNSGTIRMFDQDVNIDQTGGSFDNKGDMSFEKAGLDGVCFESVTIRDVGKPVQGTPAEPEKPAKTRRFFSGFRPSAAED